MLELGHLGRWFTRFAKERCCPGPHPHFDSVELILVVAEMPTQHVPEHVNDERVLVLAVGKNDRVKLWHERLGINEPELSCRRISGPPHGRRRRVGRFAHVQQGVVLVVKTLKTRTVGSASPDSRLDDVRRPANNSFA